MPLNTQLHSLLRTAINKREPLRKNTNALRLINGIGDKIEGLVVEQYDKHFVAQVFNSFWIKEGVHLKDFLLENFEVDYFIVKNRTQSPSSKPEAIEFSVLEQKAPSQCVIQENGLYFEVDLNDTLNTGLFLDMRSNRLLVGQACLKKKVLNCFSYTCSFGVYARAYGAKEVINVDVSKKILEKGKHNLRLNQIEAQPLEFIKADAVEYLEKALKKDNHFDIIILDPPSFARADKKIFSVEKDFSRLIELAIGRLNEQGKLFAATNFSGISHLKLEQLVRKFGGTRRIKKITHLGQDQDFIGSGQTKESHLAAVFVEY